MWLAFLSVFGYKDFDADQLRRGLRAGGSHQRAVDYTNVACIHTSSDPLKVVGFCWLLVEGKEEVLKDQRCGKITQHLTACLTNFAVKHTAASFPP